jgi:hypothetical protein
MGYGKYTLRRTHGEDDIMSWCYRNYNFPIKFIIKNKQEQQDTEKMRRKNVCPIHILRTICLSIQTTAFLNHLYF